MNVHWTDAALADLEAIETHISVRSPRYARAMAERILDRSELLSQHPLLGAIVPEYEDDTLRELFVRPYRLVYRVLGQRVDIIAVIHAARQMPPLE